MKHCFLKKLTFLLALLALSHAAVLRGRKSELKSSAKIKTRPTPPAKTAKSLRPAAKQRRLEGDGPVVSAFSTPAKGPSVKSRVYTPEELVQKVENYGHQAWECANELRELINAAHRATEPKKGGAEGKAPEKTELTLDEELKVKQAISFVKEANTALKYYIDNFILTEEVLQKYENFIEQHPDQGSSTNGVLKFMVHEFRDIQLRKFEREFFEKVKMYNSVIKDKFTPLFFLPVVNRNVHTLQVKLLNGERLIIFIKKYMAFVMRLKRGFHLMDYEKGNALFEQPDVDPKVNRYKVVTNAEYTKVENLRKKSKSYVPVTIVVGNDSFGSKPANIDPVRLPSDYIENREDIQFKAKQDAAKQAGGLGGQQTVLGSSLGGLDDDHTRLPSLSDANNFGDKIPTVDPSTNQATLMSMTVPAKKLVQQSPPAFNSAGNKILANNAPKKFVSPLDLEKEAFMRQKLADVERMYGHGVAPGRRLNNVQTIMPGDNAQTIMPGQTQTIMPGQSQTIMPESQTQTIMPSQTQTIMPSQTQTIMPESQFQGGNSKTATILPDQQGSSFKTINPSDPVQTPQSLSNSQGAKTLASRAGSNKLIETGSENLIELDSDGLPINLEIQRVPEVIRMDERYEDPFIVGGKAQTGLTAKVAELEGKRVDADFKLLRPTAQQEDTVPQKRVIYHPNEVNGGLPQPKPKELDPELSRIDEIIKDNGSIDKSKLRRVDQMLGLSGARSLWDQDLGKVYSKLRWHGLI